MTQVDQVMFRKNGNWNFVHPDEWTKMKPGDQTRLINAEAAMFFKDGNQINTLDALNLLSPELEVDPAIKERLMYVDDGIAKLKPVELVTVTYSRQVISGPAWQVQRKTVDGTSVPFSQFRGHPNDDVYDLDTSDGPLTLIADLMTDAFGHTRNAQNLIPADAIEYFDETFFSTSLGDRFWEVPATDIRAQVGSNPHIKISQD